MIRLRCPGNRHVGHIDSYMQDCSACGRNIYETDAEYARWLRDAVASEKRDAKEERIRADVARLEAEAGRKG